MTTKTGIRRLLALMLSLVLLTNSFTMIYGAELFVESEDLAEENELQSEETGTAEWTDAAEDMNADVSFDTADSEFSDGSDVEIIEEPEVDEADMAEVTEESDTVDIFQTFDETAACADGGGVSSYGQEITQDIYWQDNNVISDRYTPDAYKEWFYENGKIAISYTNSDGATITENVKVRDLIADQNKMTVTDQGGTGHYVMKFEPDAFSGVYVPKNSDGKPVTDSEGNPVSYMIEQIDLVPPNSLADKDITSNNKYYFQEITDANKADYTNQDVGNGWYYLKQYDFTVNLEFRYGSIDVTGLPDEQKEALKKALKTAIEKEFVFSYKKSINATETEVSLEAIRNQYGKDIVNITTDSSGNLAVTLTVPKIPQYRVDGTERTYHIEEADTSDDYKLNVDTSFILKNLLGDAYDGDYLAISYDNSNVANFGTITDSVYRDGKLILTLKGDTGYTGTKIWQDEEDSAHRPTTAFTLWRYSKKPGTDYTTASQVSNQNGETLKFVLPDDPKTPKFTIDFSYNTNEPHAADSVLLADGETLPKYDPEGYEYVYFTKETMADESGKADYTQFFGELEAATAENGSITVKDGTDKLPEGLTARAASDKSIYNGGTISNSLTGTVDTKIQKQWKAQAFQGQLSDVRVTFELMAKHKNPHGTEENPSLADKWYTVKNGKDSVTMEMSGFNEETLIQTGTRNMPKYDDMGHELEYQWVETGVYQGENSTTNLLQITTDADGNISGEFTLKQNGEDIHYTSKVETTTDQNGNSSSVITNRIAKNVNYEVTKKWMLGDNGTELEAPEGASVTLALVRQSSDGTTKELGRFVMNGTVGHTDEITDTENNDQKILCSEPSAWKARFENLPQYDADGRWYDYTVLEVQDNKYMVRYGEVTFDKENGTYYKEIRNYPPGTYQSIYVRKKWVDDSDSEHRGAVTFTVYQRTAENTFEEIQTVDLTSLDFWQKEITIDADIDLKNILVLETSVKNTSGTGSATVPNTDKDGVTEQARTYTPEEMEAIWKLYHSQQMSENESNTANGIYYFSDEHWYHTTYAMEQLTAGEEGMQGVPYYTVTNQRLGRINLTVTKTWADGDHTAQTDLRNQLQKLDPNAGLYVKLSCDYEGAITDAQTGKINIGNGEQQITLDNGSPAGIYQEIALNGSGDAQNMYFFNLPKYDSRGKVVHYSVSEVYAKKTADGTIKELTDEEKARISTDYIQMLSSTYRVNAHHTDDKQNFMLKNKLSGVKNVQFHKKWLDRYQFLKGNRPDIYLSLYRQVHTAADISAVSLESVFIDHEWSNTSDESNTNYHWTVTLKNQPKYDDYGYEIIYYAEEKMHIDASKFDYIPVYYEYRINGTETKVGNAFGPDDLGADSSNPDSSEYVNAGYIIPAAATSESTTYLLREDGTFVNRLQKDIRIEGKKIWGNIPSGFPDEELPKATFTLKRYKALKADQTPDYDTTFTSSVTIESGNWGKQKVNSEYQFVLEYTGENVNTLDTDQNKLKASPADETQGAERIQLYDGFGNRYDYQVTEELTMPSDASGNVTDKTLVYIDPQVNEFVVQNYYRSMKGQLTVKKILDVQKEDTETYPSVTFELTRFYKKNDGTLVEDTVFGTKTLTLKHDQFTDSNGVISQTGTFENLEIYAPNGREYQYCIKEKKEGLGSYTLTHVGVGDCAKGVGNTKLPDGQTEPANQLNAAASEDTNAESSYTAQVSGLYASDDKNDPKTDATFQNKASEEFVILTGSKVWDDNNNVLNLRPSVEQLNGQDSNYPVPAISVRIYRYAQAQSGESNAIGSADSPLKVESSKYSVSWTADATDTNKYVYTITGAANSGELEKYAPNGMPWIYGVKETYGNGEELPGYKTNTDYYWCNAGEEINGAWTENAGPITNSLTKTNIRVVKRWIAGENISKDQDRVMQSNIGNENAYKDYLGYYMKVQFNLQARIAGKYGTSNNQEPVDASKSEWMNVKDLFTDTTNGLGMETGTVSNEPKTYRSVFADAVSAGGKFAFFDSDNNIVFEQSGFMTNDKSWMANFTASPMLPEKVKANSGKYAANDGSYYKLEYRFVERQISVYKDSSAASPLATIQFSGIQDDYTSALNDYDKSKMQYGATQISAKDLFTLIGQNYNNLQGGVPGSLWNNLLPVTQLTVTKAWNDTGNAYGTRYLKDGKWSVDFVIQRKIKNDNSDWENVYSYNNGTKSDKFVTVTITGENATGNTGTASISGLPVYGIGDGGTVVEYEYRARELNPGWENAKTEAELSGYIINGDSGTKQEYAYKGNITGTAGGIYDVTATDSVPNESSADGTTEQKHYQTVVSNAYNGILTRYAQKQWKLPSEFSVTGGTGKTVWNYPVTLELKYKKTDGTLQSFTKPATVILDGTQDEGVNSDLSDLARPYGEYEAWKAIWKGIPDYIPGSETETTSDGKTITKYYIVETQTGFYQEISNKDTAGDGIAGRDDSTDNLTFTNTPTEFLVSKTVDLGDAYEFNLDDQEFTFKLTNDSDISGEYWMVKKKKDSNGNLVSTDTAAYPKQYNMDGTKTTDTFTLKNGETMVFYGLPVYKNGSTTEKVTYTVTETNSHPSDSEFETKFDTTVTVSNSDAGGTAGTTVSSKDGTSGSVKFPSFAPAGDAEKPATAFTNTLEGAIHLIKTDGAGNKLADAEFTIKYRKKDGTSDEFLPLDNNVCSNMAGNTTGSRAGVKVSGSDGKVDFTDLKLGYEYQITETKAPAGALGLQGPIIVELPMLLDENTTANGSIKPVTTTTDGKKVFVELQYTISNSKFSMPVTSGSGFFWPGMLGLALAGAGCIVWTCTGTKKKKREEITK
ncbi:Cna B-type domain-containing protein [Blautia sp. MSJ-19]|uniref:Cna B-type domain-containing protein n=1 Tax=Blautia sp. MSJ-19 TaxID=2841517 RepID=UPI001C0EF59A|nr:Cna B-type domain-containing protein [Blautia sp. MSJ-19]MBU5482664.1 Cna B-type domain-containing protein [Blautia sp. MSJ-19]